MMSLALKGLYPTCYTCHSKIKSIVLSHVGVSNQMYDG